MNIYTLDTETYKWNEEKQIYEPDLNYDALLTDVYDGKNHYTFKENNKLWEFLIEKGIKAKENGSIINIYAHNAQFDFYKVIKNTKYMKNIVIFSHNPFIADFKIKGKTIIKILDSIGLFKMSLANVGKIIGHDKTTMPENILHEKPRGVQEQLITTYCHNDTEITYKAVIKIIEFTKKTNIPIRRFITISQIANNVILNDIANTNIANDIFQNVKMRDFFKSDNHKLIRIALRGGKVEAYKTGIYKNVIGIDKNSLYSESAMEMKFPNLKTEKMIKQPLRFGTDFLNKIGISKIMIKNENDKYGFIGVRTGTDNHYLNKGQIGIGTWTNDEIKYALENGYKLIECEYTIIYDETNNPYKEILPKYYNLKKNAKNEFERFFYKAVMNHSFGKLGQYKPYVEYRIDDIENAEKYLKRNYEMVAGQEYDRVFRKEKEYVMKKYYAPLIISYIYAQARIIMHKEMKKIPKELILYSDTDSLYFQNETLLNNYKMGTEIGEWKIEHQNQDIHIIGRKTYRIGDEIKISGFYKSDLNIEDFEKGIVKSKKMNTIKTTGNMENWGTFNENVRDLLKQQQKTEEIKEKYSKERLLIDVYEEDINYFYESYKNIFF